VKPTIELKMIEWEFGNKVVIEAVIPEGLDKPYYSKDDDGKWWAHIRVKDQSLLASKIVLDVLKRNSGKQQNIINYTRHEEGLLKYLQKNEKATLKELCQALNISRWRAQRILVALVSAGIIRNHTTEKMEFFTLS
jgi:predicted HTH transcriptional regulator